MHGRRAVLEPGDMRQVLSEIDLVPAQTHQFGYAQAVAVSDQDPSRIPKPMAPLRCGRGDDLPRLPFPTDIPGCDSRSWGRAGDFPFYDGWGSRMASLRARLLFKARLPTFCF